MYVFMSVFVCMSPCKRLRQHTRRAEKKVYMYMHSSRSRDSDSNFSSILSTQIVHRYITIPIKWHSIDSKSYNSYTNSDSDSHCSFTNSDRIQTMHSPNPAVPSHQIGQLQSTSLFPPTSRQFLLSSFRLVQESFCKIWSITRSTMDSECVCLYVCVCVCTMCVCMYVCMYVWFL